MPPDLTWSRIHVDFLSPFSFVRTCLQFTLTFVRFSPPSVCEVKKIGIYVDILTKIWFSRRLRKNFLRTSYRFHWGPHFRRRQYKWHFLFPTGWYSKAGVPNLGGIPTGGNKRAEGGEWWTFKNRTFISPDNMISMLKTTFSSCIHSLYDSK